MEWTVASSFKMRGRAGSGSLRPLAPSHSATGWSICGTKEYTLIFEFSSNFDDFFNQNQQFCEFLTIFLIKMAKMMILQAEIA